MENIEKKNIMPDKKAGEAGAYAEKPFRDSLIKG